MKKVKVALNMTFIAYALFFFFNLPACTHDDEEIDAIIEAPAYNYGIEKIKVSEGYGFDKTHSSVRWETFYLGTAALLTGRFNDFAIEVELDQEDPTNIYVMGKVTLSSVNTGEPGRDAGCLLGTFGTDVSDEAIFVSKSSKEDGQGGYDVTGDLTFHGVTDEVVLKLRLVNNQYFDENSGVRNAPLYVAGLSGEFEFNAKSVFGIESGNISDRVVVKINAQFKRSL